MNHAAQTAAAPQIQIIDASAGTGKTTRITEIVAEWIRDGRVTIDRLLVITFTRAAAAELRDRVNAALRAALLAEPAPTAPEAQRLEAALADFDRANISTIHGFAQRALRHATLWTGFDPGLQLVSNFSEIIDEVVSDELARRWSETTSERACLLLPTLRFDRHTLETVATAMTRVDPCTPETGTLYPAAPADQSVNDELEEFSATWAAFQDYLEGNEANDAWSAYVSEGSKYLRNFTTRSHGALTKLKDWAAVPAKFTSSDRKGLEWFLLDGGKVTDADKIENFGGYPLMLAVKRFLNAVDALHGVRARLHAGFAERVRPALEAALKRRGLITQDQLIAGLADGVRDEVRREQVAKKLKAAYDIAIVDEFQDTDAAQWEILRVAFLGSTPDGTPRLLAVGDPKQAIYSFRDADIDVYRAARQVAERKGRVDSLATNYRSDKALVGAINTVWTPHTAAIASLGQGFGFEPVDAREACRVTRWGTIPETGGGARERRPLEMRWFTQPDDEQKWPSKKQAEGFIAEDCAQEVLHLLATLELKRSSSEEDPRLRPSDVAILVPTHDHAAAVRSALHRAGLPSIVQGKTSLFKSTAARWVLAWLDALADLEDDARTRSYALTPLGGWSPVSLGRAVATAEAAFAASYQQLRADMLRWAALLSASGPFIAFDRMMAETNGWARILANENGERDATDLRQLIEALETSRRRGRYAITALADALRDALAEREDGSGEAVGDEDQLLLESDANAIRIVTQHSSKGLQYPVVLLPFSWDRKDPKHHWPLVVRRNTANGGSKNTDRESDGKLKARSLILAPERDPVYLDAWETHQRERCAEALRLLYVATTRAKHHLIVWIGRHEGNKNSPANAIEQWLIPTQRVPTPPAELRLALTAIAASDDRIGVARTGSVVGQPEETAHTRRPVTLRPWHGPKRLGGDWSRRSYSNLGRHTIHPDNHDALKAAVDRLHQSGLDEPATGSRFRIRGTAFGDWVHAVLDGIDFENLKPLPRTQAAGLAEWIGDRGVRHGIVDPSDHQRLEAALPLWTQQPLSGQAHPLPEGFCLAKLNARDRLSEYKFQCALGTAPQAGGRRIEEAAVRAVFSALMEHGADHGLAPETVDWLRIFLGDGENPPKIFGAIRGELTGSIDLLFRVSDGAHGHRYWICDYKTNALIETPSKLKRRHYTRPAMARAMSKEGFHLQSLLYTLALDRLLRQRLGASYVYNHHIGGHLYLFLRGLDPDFSPDGTDNRLGVWTDRWPEFGVVGLDLALTGATETEVKHAMQTFFLASAGAR